MWVGLTKRWPIELKNKIIKRGGGYRNATLAEARPLTTLARYIQHAQCQPISTPIDDTRTSSRLTF